MARFVWLDGFLGSQLRDNVRILHIESLKGRNVKEPMYEKIPCIYWNRLPNCELTRLSKGAFVSIKGRIESNDDIGAYVLVETIQFLLPPGKDVEKFDI